VRSLEPLTIIRGNHDKVASGLENGDSFNLVARSAVQWTYEMLTPENLDYLLKLPAGPIAVDDKVEICHGSPFDEDAYIFDELDALRAFEVSTRPVCLFGHTHVAIAYRRLPDRLEMPAGPGDTDQVRLPLNGDARYLVNVGSVGQPRDGDPRAAAGIVDTAAGMIELYRVRYAVEEAQRKIRMAGLPEVLPAPGARSAGASPRRRRVTLGDAENTRLLWGPGPLLQLPLSQAVRRSRVP
jgi:diadenosine tetraphosphatase ApaH/serine/threonine PP2A family protein phosphatase